MLASTTKHTLNDTVSSYNALPRQDTLPPVTFQLISMLQNINT